MILLVLAFIIFELVDIFSNKSEYFVDIIGGYVKIFSKFPLLFLFGQGSFLLLAFCIFALEICNFLIVSIFICYAIDLYMKNSIIDRILNKKDLGIYKDLFVINPKISKLSRLVISSIVILLFYMAIS